MMDLSHRHTARQPPVLVGREREQAMLRQALDEMLAGHGSLVLVTGEAGIGKTTLVEWLAGEAEEQGYLVLWGHAYDLSVTPPYGPWLEILRAYPQDDSLRALPPFVDDLESTAALGSQDRLFSAACDFFVEVGRCQPLVMILEDLHWADQASLSFLRVLARSIVNQRILLFVTYRSDELHHSQPLYTFLPALIREARAERVEMRPLNNAEQRALIESRYTLTTSDQSRLAHYLLTHSGGNPLYARELLRTLEDSDVLVEDESTWRVGDLEHIRIPTLLQQVIEGRLARLGEVPRSLLQVAAIIGQDVPVKLWLQVSEASDEDLAEAIEEGQASQLIEETGLGASYRFRHALFREALYAEMIALRRGRWHLKVAEALAATSSPDADSVAQHFLRADDDRAIDWLFRAGERAQRAYAWLDAAERFETAQQLMGSEPERIRERGWLLYRIGRLTRYVNPAQGVTYLEIAERIAREVDDRVLAAYAQADRGELRCYATDNRQGLTEMAAGDAALQLLFAERVEIDEFTHHWAGAELTSGHFAFDTGVQTVGNARRGGFATRLGMVGRIHEARELAQRHIAEIEQHHRFDAAILESYADTHLALSTYHWSAGQPEAARAAFARSREINRQTGRYYLIGASALFELNEVVIPYQADDREAIQRLMSIAAEALQRASGAESDASMLRSGQVSLTLLHGDWRAVALDARAETSTRFSDGGSYWVPVTLAKLAAYRGDLTTAWQQIWQELPAGPSTEPGGTFFSHAIRMHQLAVGLALSAGDLPVAYGWLRAHDRWLDWNDSVLGRADGALLWAQYHHAENNMVLALQTAEQALALATNPRQPLALIAVHRFLGRLHTETQQFDQAEQHLQESIALADACQAPFERALTLLELAELRLARAPIR